LITEKSINGDETLRKWLSEFKKDSTSRTYLFALNNFKDALSISDLGDYLLTNPDVTADIRKFLASMDGRPSKTVHTYTAAVKMFMQDHGLKVPEDEWRKIRRRGFMPKRSKAETHDRKPNREEIKKILNYCDIKCKSEVLFLVSSGARIGETLQLKVADLKLDADPPEANIRSEYTKGGVGGRIVYFSYEARDAIKDWLRIKNETNRRSGDGSYKSEKVFPWDSSTARFMWNMAADKASLDKRDNSTNRRVLHLHSLRKFFRSNIGLDSDLTNALMGHVEYLDDSYLRLEQEGEIAKAYKEAMPNVSIYNVEDQQLKKQTNALEAENAELKTRIAKMEAEKNDLAVRMQKTESKLSDLEKLIREKLAQLK
jgi:integrase